MGSKPKEKEQTPQQLQLEREQIKFTQAQLAEMERQRLLPTPEAPKPLPALSPTVSKSAADTAQAETNARRTALRRNAPGRSTIFAGETGSSLGGRKTLLG